jgi:hypothetical protein
LWRKITPATSWQALWKDPEGWQSFVGELAAMLNTWPLRYTTPAPSATWHVRADNLQLKPWQQLHPDD